jgi:hypothetical protein
MDGTQSLAEDFLRDLEELDEDVTVKRPRLEDEEEEETQIDIAPLAQSQVLANDRMNECIERVKNSGEELDYNLLEEANMYIQQIESE